MVRLLENILIVIVLTEKFTDTSVFFLIYRFNNSSMRNNNINEISCIKIQNFHRQEHCEINRMHY